MGRTITIDSFSKKDVDKAIKNLISYKQTLNRRIEELVKLLTERGEEIAKLNVVELGAFDTGVLESSIQGYYSPLLGVGIIRTNCYYAVYVEFGTGIVGEKSQHPKAGEKGYAYDVNNHGEDGWFYYNGDTGKSGWTKGMPSRPFMYDTVVQLRKECNALANQKLRSR